MRFGSFKQGNLLYSLNEKQNTAEIKGCAVKSANKIIIPKSIPNLKAEYTITGINEYAFKFCKIQSVEFVENSKIQSISSYAFSCSIITNITISSQLTEICPYAFANCKTLKTLTIPINSELKTIGKGAFIDTMIDSLTIPSKLIDLQEGWCIMIHKLNKIDVNPNNPRYKIYKDEMIIGKSSIENDCPYDSLVFCVRNSKDVSIPSFITKIEPYSFSGCSLLKEVKLDDLLSELRGGFRSNDSPFCFNLKKICENSFSFCYSLASFVIPESSLLETIENNVFFDSGIKTLTISSKSIVLNGGIFNHTAELNEVNINPLHPLYKNFDNSLIIGKSSFESDDFDVLVFCPRNMEEITIPNFIKVIGSFAFDFCCKLKKVEFQIDSNIKILNNYCFANSFIEKISLPISITKIGEKSFYSCKNLSLIEIPPNIKTIEEYAFYSCEKLQKVTFSKNSELKIINKGAFMSTLINEISIPQHVEIIEEDAFSYCKRLQKVIFTPNSELKIIKKGAFESTSINKILIPQNVETIEEKAFGTCNNLQKVIFAQNSKLNEICKDTFNGSSLISFTVPASVKKISGEPFMFCEQLQIVEFDDDALIECIDIDIFGPNKKILLMIPYKLDSRLKNKDKHFYF